jgi:hypothetical protein
VMTVNPSPSSSSAESMTPSDVRVRCCHIRHHRCCFGARRHPASR